MSKIGLGFAKRKIGKNLTRTITYKFNENENSVTIRNQTAVRDATHTIVFDEFIEGETEDGRMAKVTVSFSDGKLTVKEEWKGPTSSQTWSIVDGNLEICLDCDGKCAKLTYKRV